MGLTVTTHTVMNAQEEEVLVISIILSFLFGFFIL